MGKIVERRVCPPRFQERVTLAGGLNPYGAPNFRIDWGQTYSVRRGGVWDSPDYYFRGYRDVLEDGRPCWVLRQWNPPEAYCSPDAWFLENRCPKSGLQLLGDFPWQGQYEAIQPLVWRGLVNGRMVVEHMPLNGLILEALIPMVIAWKLITPWRKEATFRELQERKQKAADSKIEDARHAAKRPFAGAVSYRGQRSRSSVIEQRIKAIEQYWNRAAEMFHREGLGVTIH